MIQLLFLFLSLLSYSIQDAAVQLIQPTADHAQLLVNEVGINYLSSIKEPSMKKFSFLISSFHFGSSWTLSQRYFLKFLSNCRKIVSFECSAWNFRCIYCRTFHSTKNNGIMANENKPHSNRWKQNITT